MPRLHTKQEMLNLALAVTASTELVTYHGLVYEARDFETGSPDPAPERAVWIQQKSDEIMAMAKAMDMIFATEAEFHSFKYMIRQGAVPIKDAAPWVMIKHNGGLAYMTDFGLITIENPGFSPNFINHSIIEESDLEIEGVKKLFGVISDWLGGDEQAHSLLYHLSTALQPGWAARKYLLFIGEGNNGKGILLSMLRKLFGPGNSSGVLRQDIAGRRPPIKELNNKLANIVFDGPQSYITDSGPEKTLTAGEPLDIELKYENDPFTVQTNALFIEALNKEPKGRDKSAAIQKRVTRFLFPNTYEDDLHFKNMMTTDRLIDALLTLLWQHWVAEDEVNLKLKQTRASQDMQVSFDLERNPVLAWIEMNARKDEKFVASLSTGRYDASALVDALQPWMAQQNYGARSVTDIWDQLNELFQIERRTVREGGRAITKRFIKRPLPNTERALRAMEGATDDDRAVVSGE